ncbi:hypothetical protein EV424DRAFT_1445861 [Suillus variegatus]|nr:hypothetical protein EV424DRAFT_1445861 [Suillus variegatus]
MSEQVSWHAARLHRPSPINIVIRIWPGDTLHHFVLDPNPAYVPGRDTSLYNLPYLVQPTLVQTICSPALSNLKSHFALGRYGTMLLLDNHYPDLADRMEYSDFQHQRLSVRILTTRISTSHGSQDSMASRVRGGSYWNRAAIDEESRENCGQ